MKLYFYMLDTMADWEYAYLLPELHSRRYFCEPKKDLEIITVSHDKSPKTSMGGLSMVPAMTVSKMVFSEEDYLILPGGDRWLEKENQEILLKAKEYIDQDLHVAAICGATFGLARHGALDFKAHTSNDKGYMQSICPEYKGEAYYQYKLAVNDKNLITATGIAPLEFAYEVLKSLKVFSDETLSHWYDLYDKKEAKYFFGLMESMQKH